MSDIATFYGYGSSAWIMLQGALLAFDPEDIIRFYYKSTIISDGADPVVSHRSLITIRSLGGFLIAIAIACFIIAPTKAPSQLPSPNEKPTPFTSTVARGMPNLGSVVMPFTMLIHVVLAGYAYTRFITENSLKWQALMVVGAFWASAGLFALLFGGETPRPDDKTPRQQRAEKKGLKVGGLGT